MAGILKGSNVLLNLTKAATKEIPIAGPVLKSYLGTVQDYINENADISLRHPEYYEIDEATGKMRGIAEQKYEDIPVGHEFDYADFSTARGAGSLGPRQRIFGHRKMHPVLPGGTVILPGVRQVRDFPDLLEETESYLNKMHGWNYGHYPIEPVVGIEQQKGRHVGRYFASNQNINPNAAFATTGFTKTHDRRIPEKISMIKI